ncbi:translation initiation factor IF-2 [Streptomyces sp. N50]|uniref:translation initiation factor IF-2 n=1 Tax=Streptomyces sp. N50 TaxID=3081765 RepID=UPI0029620573|nr:translation initiation factor IF-2 [Streptomyces sp. N50]WOX11850.1 translation initiation factor IF-2 [Streptomyces sp. N50]
MSAAAPGTGSTSFEEMSHEQMLAWLDQANSGTVRLAADRLTAAAEEIRRIGEELKVRPQYVEWKGEGADAFRTWAGDLANSTLRLGDFSDDAAKWLGQTSDAIAHVQASIPRDTKNAQANPNAASRAHNTADTTAVTPNSATELAAIAAAKEKTRQEAASQMLKLGQSYRLSATQLDGLERPVFPPPPDAIRPPERYGSSEDLARSEGVSSHRVSGGATASGPVGAGGVAHSPAVPPDQSGVKTIIGGQTSADRPVLEGRERSAQVGIDSVASLPHAPHTATSTTGGVPSPVRPETGAFSPAGGIAAPIAGVASRGRIGSGGPGRSAVGGRMSGPLGQGTGSVIGRGAGEAGPVANRDPRGSGAASGRSAPGGGMPAGRGVPAGSGIVGGRPTGTPATGGSTGRPPGSTVVGGERAGSRGPAGRMPVAEPGRQATAAPVAGRSFPAPSNGVVGRTPQRTARAPARPDAPVPSAPTRGGISGGTPTERGPRGGVPGGAARPSGRTGQGKQEQRARRRGEPPPSG